MNEPTSREVVRTLLLPTTDVESRVRMLTTVVLDLMMELEALREARVADSGYRQAYRRTGLLAHDAAGPSDGVEKLMSRFYLGERDARGRAWRESLMLGRLGFSAKEIEAYREEAASMETRTRLEHGGRGGRSHSAPPELLSTLAEEGRGRGSASEGPAVRRRRGVPCAARIRRRARHGRS